jgi:hypothetical protein
VSDDLSPGPRISLGRLEWGVIVALVFSGGSALFNAGVLYRDVVDHERRLIIVENKGEGVASRLSAIEGKLDFLVDQYKADRRPPHQRD